MLLTVMSPESIICHAHQKCGSVSFPLHTHQHWVLSFLESFCLAVACHCILNVSFIEGTLYNWISNNHFTTIQRSSSYGCFLYLFLITVKGRGVSRRRAPRSLTRSKGGTWGVQGGKRRAYFLAHFSELLLFSDRL